MVRPRARTVVGAFALARVAIGAAFAAAPRLSGASAAEADGALMTRSFAVREVALGVGGLWAVARAGREPSTVRLLAGLGALTDSGDLWAACAGGGRDGSPARLPAAMAATGLVCELWAFATAAD